MYIYTYLMVCVLFRHINEFNLIKLSCFCCRRLHTHSTSINRSNVFSRVPSVPEIEYTCIVLVSNVFGCRLNPSLFLSHFTSHVKLDAPGCANAKHKSIMVHAQMGLNDVPYTLCCSSTHEFELLDMRWHFQIK